MPIVKGYIIDADKRSIRRYDIEENEETARFPDRIFDRVGRIFGFHDTVFDGVSGEWSDTLALFDYAQSAGARMQVGKLWLRGRCFLLGDSWENVGPCYMDVPETPDEVKAMTVFWG